MSAQGLASGFAGLLSEVRAAGRGASRASLLEIFDRFFPALVAAADPYAEAALSEGAKARGLDRALEEAARARSGEVILLPRRRSYGWAWAAVAAAVLLGLWLTWLLAPREPLYVVPTPKAGVPGVEPERPKEPVVQKGPETEIRAVPAPRPAPKRPSRVAEKPAPPAGAFGAVQGEPLVFVPGAKEGVPATPGMALAYGSRVDTGDFSRAQIRFADGTVLALDYNTVLRVASGFDPIIGAPGGRPDRVFLEAGRVTAVVAHVSETSRFRVETPVATTEVLGTEFGLALVRPAEPEQKLRAVLQVKAGRVAFYNAFGRVTAPTLTESTAVQGSAPTEPKRIATLKWIFLRLEGDSTASTYFLRSVQTRTLDRREAAYAADGLFGWSGITVKPSRATGRLRIAELVPGGPGEKAGIVPGDAVLAVDGRDVRDEWSFDRILLRNPNRTIAIRVLRGDETRLVRIANGITAGSKYKVDARIAARLRELTWMGIDGRRAEAKAALQAEAQRRGAAPFFTNLGVLHEMDDEMGPAIRAYQRAVRLNPTHPRYRLNLALALQKIGNHDRAVEELSRCVQYEGWHEFGAEQLAKAQVLAGREEAALTTLDTALRHLPGNAVLWMDKADVLAGLGRFEEAVAAARKATELRPNLPRFWTKLGQLWGLAGEAGEAERAYGKALELHPREIDALLQLGGVRMRAGRFEEAVEIGRRAVAAAPEEFLPRNFLGNVMRVLGQLEEAEAEFRAAVRLEPDNPLGHFNLGLVCRMRGKLAEAEAEYKEAIRLDPTLWAGFASLGTLYNDAGRFEEADGLLREAVRLAPNSTAVHNSLGWNLRQQGRFAEAEPEFRKALELDPRNRQAYMNLGYLLQHLLKRPDDAEPVYRAFAENLPNDPYALNGLAYFLAEFGRDLDTALKMSRRAVELAPKDPDIVDTLAFILLLRGELDEVEGLFKRAIELYGKPSTVINSPASLSWRHLGAYYEKVGDRAKAIEAYRKSLELEPGNAEALEALRRLGGSQP